MNNQLLHALTQIRDSLQQQHVQQQQQKVQQQLQKQQQHLRNLSNGITTAPPMVNRNYNSGSMQQQYSHQANYLNNNSTSGHPNMSQDSSCENNHIMVTRRGQPISNISSNNNNTTKVLITSDNGSLCSTSSNGNPMDSSNRDSAAYLEEHALKLLSELKSSSC